MFNGLLTTELFGPIFNDLLDNNELQEFSDLFSLDGFTAEWLIEGHNLHLLQFAPEIKLISLFVDLVNRIRGKTNTCQSDYRYSKFTKMLSDELLFPLNIEKDLRVYII